MAIRQAESITRRVQGLLDGGVVADVSDAELLARFTAERDEAAEIAFAALVGRHGPMVFRVCRQIVGDRHTAEDAFQATFLILARRAGSIHGPELLAHWLHGVAFRTAREARMREYRRQRRECTIAIAKAGLGEPVDRTGRPDHSLVCREEFEALHQEVSRLPERYRAPVVLCDLEGLSYQAAALRLGCPVGTIGVRLRRARERLRARMARRGLAPTASVLTAILAPADPRSACPPPVLVESTIKAAMGFAANSAAPAGLATTQAIALTERILRTMAFSRFKAATHLTLAVGIAAAVAWLARPHTAPAKPAALAGEAQLLAGQPPPGKAASAERAPLQPPAAAAPASDASAKTVADRASVATPKVREPLPALTLPDQVFAGAPAARAEARTIGSWQPRSRRLTRRRTRSD